MSGAAGTHRAAASETDASSRVRFPRGGPAPLRLLLSVLERLLSVSDEDRARGIGLHAGSGSGKSVFLGRVLCLLDLLRGIPQVILDPHGPLVSNLILGAFLLPHAVQRHIWPRVIYVDMAAKDGPTVGFPLLFRQPGESLVDVADRVLETFRKLDPHLQSASIQGWNSLVRVGRPTLMVLAGLGETVAAAESLLTKPHLWTRKLQALRASDPSAAPAVDFFLEDYNSLDPRERSSMIGSLLVKLEPFRLDPHLREMFCVNRSGIDLARVVDERCTVLLDFRNETNSERRRFKTRWIYEWFMAFVKSRGAGTHVPLGLVIDELTELTNQVALDQDLFARDIDELVNVYSRNYSVFPTLAHQEMFQLSPSTQKTLLTMGTQMIGLTADMEAAKYLSEQFASIDPYHVKRIENVWGGGPLGPVVVERREAFMPLEEQVLLSAQQLLSLRPFEFLVKLRHESKLRRVSARRLVGDEWASDHADAIARARRKLASRNVEPESMPSISCAVLDTMEIDHDKNTIAADRVESTQDEDWSTPPRW